MTTNEEIKRLVSDFADRYKVACESSRAEHMKTLLPGSKVPSDNHLYGEEAKAEFNSIAKGLRDQALALIEKDEKETRAKLTAAPNEEAVKVCTLLKMRDDVTREEINDLISEYGDNPQTYKAITSIAREKNIKGFNLHPVEEHLLALDDMKSSVNRYFSLANAENGHSSPAYVACMNMAIDGTFSG